MGTPLNSKIFIYITLLCVALTPFTSHSASPCENTSSETTCVNIVVKSNEQALLSDMVVFLEPIDGQTVEQSSKEVVIGQRDKTFSPYISVSQVNSAVNFVNQDDITHHIYSAGSDNKFSFKIRAGKTNALSQFKEASEIAMGCNIHDWMSGYLLVVDTPYFGKTDKQGSVVFSLKEAGKYNVVVWHPQMPTDQNRMMKQVNIVDNTEFSITLSEELDDIPTQESDDDFDFLSEY